jgi:hypothetical protein
MTQQITGELFKMMVLNGTTAIENNKQEINELNVFPVPDGDTGTNMSLTIGAAEKALAAMTPGTLGHVADVTAGALLRGARGNSGVILSLLFRGFARCLKDVDAAGPAEFAQALIAGVDSAYKAVMKPSEGTILTVSRLAAGAAVEAAETESDVELVIERALAKGYIALADTINQNPVLQKAGVIDAGAKGYLYILDGMLKALRGVTLEKSVPGAVSSEQADFSQFTAEDITFTYCTEFIIKRNQTTKTNRLCDFLDVRGDSVVVVEDDEIIKVHVHTNDPGVVLTEALSYGSLLSIKIDNQREQHSEAVSGTSPVPAPAIAPAPPKQVELKEFGIVAVCAGRGIEAVFRDLGADGIVTGGQTMNPSTEDILEKITATHSNTVFVLPNNKNIIMAAEQCAPLTIKRVIVIPTMSIPQGVSAMLSVFSAEGVEEMITVMTDAAKNVRTALVTTAVRDSVFDDRDIKQGEHLALLDGSLISSGSDANAVIGAVAEALSREATEYITIFTGEDAKEAETETVVELIGSSVSSSTELSVIEGNQPVYKYIISAE